MRTTETIDDCLSLIGQKCNKLLKLELTIDKEVSISDRFFTSFTKFKAIKKLKINLPKNIVVKGSVECFKHCKQLKKLHINYPNSHRKLLRKHRVICTETTNHFVLEPKHNSPNHLLIRFHQ